MKSTFLRYTLSDALLPLLDLSMLLLGFFIILFALAAESPSRSVEGAELTGQVIVVTIQNDGNYLIQTRESTPELGLDEEALKQFLNRIRTDGRDQYLAIIRHQDVWLTDQKAWDACRRILREAQFHYAEVFR